MAAQKRGNVVLNIGELVEKQGKTNELLGNLAVSHNGNLVYLNRSKIVING
jgi:hypothetical protein